jgi:hypothetical protein
MERRRNQLKAADPIRRSIRPTVKRIRGCDLYDRIREGYRSSLTVQPRSQRRKRIPTKGLST